MCEEKGLDPAVADKIGEYVKHKGGPSLLEILLADSALTANKRAKEGIEEMGTLFKYLEAYQVVDKVSSFTPRSLDLNLTSCMFRSRSTSHSLEVLTTTPVSSTKPS